VGIHQNLIIHISKSAKTGGVPFGRHSVGRNMIEKMFLLKNKIDLSEKRNGKNPLFQTLALTVNTSTSKAYQSVRS
jgi:hypothetical protein